MPPRKHARTAGSSTREGAGGAERSRLRLEAVPIERLNPAPYNPRSISKSAMKGLETSIDRWGLVQPVVWNRRSGNVVGGHQRLKVIQKQGAKTVDVVVVDLDDADEKALNVTLNNPLISGEFTEGVLPLIRGALVSMPDLGAVLQMPELAALIRENLNVAPEEIESPPTPEPPDDPVTKPGDLIVLGDHRLLCGDSGSEADLDRLLGGAPIHLLNTDPPYNVKVEPRSNNAIAAGLSSFGATNRGRPTLPGGIDSDQAAADLSRHPEKSKPTHKKMRAKDRPLANDFVSDESFEKMLLAWFGNASRVMVPGSSYYAWGGYANVANYPPALKATGLYFSQMIVWDKQHPVLTRKDFMGAHEWCFYGWKEGAGHRFFGPSNVRDIWAVKKVTPQQMVHLTEKPVELAARAIQYSSKAGENVLDLFGGSGSTLIGAEKLGRRAFLMELDPAYCDVIVARFEQSTGKKADRRRA